MPLTTPQLQAIKTWITANVNTLSDGEIADLLNTRDVPDFWVWRTDVTRAQIYHDTGPDGTLFDWTVYKAQTQGEQGAWTQMFMGDQANFALPNLRAAIVAIFSGAGGAAQRTHILAVGRRKATLGEKLLSTGAGTPASVAVAGYALPIMAVDCETARRLP